MQNAPILHEGQKQVVKDNHRFRVLSCGRRWGKTTLAVEEMIGCAVSKGGRKIAYIAPTYQQARDLAWNDLKRRLAPVLADTNESRLELTVKTANGGQSSIILRGWESIETLRGIALDFVVLDEVAMMRGFEETWQSVIRPTLTDKRGHGLFISTPRGFNHFYDLFSLEQKDQDYRSFHYTSYDNPFVPKDELDKAKNELTVDRFAQEYLAEFRKMEGLVYKEFDRQKHLIGDGELYVNGKRRFDVVEKLLGVDFGYTNPMAVSEIWRDRDDRYFIVSEWYKTGKANIEMIEYCKSLSPNAVYPDPAEPDRIKEMKNHGLNCHEVSKDVEAGINTVRTLFKQNRLFIHRNCINLIHELETYQYKLKQPDRNEPEEPVKENDHACFAAGTIVDGGRIEDVGVQTGVENVYEYQIAGERIVSTVNHPVCTQRGFCHIDTLRYDDVVWKKRSSFMQVSGGIAIRRIPIVLCGFISAVTKRIVEAKGRDSIVSSGKKRTALSLMATIYIISTTIPSITHSTILLLFSALNTLASILRMRGELLRESISNRLFGRLQSGLEPLKANVEGEKSGRTMPTFCMTDRSSREPVIYVGNSTKQKREIEADGAIIIASRRRYVGRVPVYNLKTRSGMYLANGVMVSNCDALRYALHMNARGIHQGIISKREFAFDGNITY